MGQPDADSKGLLLLTNDGELTNSLNHPRDGIPKTYRILVDGQVAPETIAMMEKGIWMADRMEKGSRPAAVRSI